MRCLLLSFVLLLLSAAVAYGCECGGPHREEFRRAKAIFVGEALSVGTDKLFNPNITDGPLYAVTFRVEKRWKGGRRGEVTLLAEGCYGMCCLVQFEAVKKYLVYAYEGSYVPYSCAWSAELSSHRAAWEMKDLNSLWFRAKARLWPF